MQGAEEGLQVGGTLGHYRLEAVLGEGGMGVVFLAHRHGGDQVAVKVLKRQLSDDATFVGRFLREARVAAAVSNEHLVPILDSGEIDGRFFLASRYVRGGSLGERLRSGGPLRLPEAIRTAAEVGAGLDALHASEIVHRDVKPGNVMLDELGGAALTDFGLAKGPAYTVLTRAGQVMGTLNYLAPELIEGKPGSRASDIYALGCLVYECLVGSPPFSSENVLEVVSAHVDQAPEDPTARRSDLPPALGPIVLTALAKDPAERPRSARAYANMLAVAARR